MIVRIAGKACVGQADALAACLLGSEPAGRHWFAWI
jgi:hypothetical protein